MAERLETDLVLNDQVSGAADKAAQSLKRVESQAKKTQKSGLDQFANSWMKIGYAADFARVKQEKAAEKAAAKYGKEWERTFTKIATAQHRAEQRAHKRAEKAAEKEKEHSLLSGIKEGFGFGKLASASFVGSFAAESLIEGAKKAVEIIADGIKDAFKAAGDEEKLRLSYRLTLGEKAGEEYMEEAGRLAKLAGFSKSQTAEQIRPLLGAGFRDERLTQAYALATDIGARKGGGAENVNAAIEAIQRIELKGGIGKKQLIGLGLEKNESFYKDIAATLHVSQKTAEKMVEEGKVNSQIIINHLSNLVNKQQGGPGGTGGSLYAKTFASRIERLKNLPEEFFREMVNAPGFQVVSDKIGEILERLDPESPNGKKIIGALTNAMGSLADWVEKTFTPDNIDRFANSIGELIPKIERIASAFLTIGEGVANVVSWTSNHSGWQNSVLKRALNSTGLTEDHTDEAEARRAAAVMPASQGAPVNITQTNTFNVSEKEAADRLKEANKFEAVLERARQQGARPR